MNRRTGLLVLLTLALAWLAYETWSPRWQERLADRAAVRRCKDIGRSEHLSVTALHQRHARCEAMEAAYQRKWSGG